MSCWALGAVALVVTPLSRSDPIGGSELNPGCDTILLTGTLIDRFFLRAELVPVVIQTISVITKIILIYKRTTTGVVPFNIYIHILSPIYLYMYIFLFNTKHQRSRKQCGERLSLSWPALLMWDVLSSILVFCSYTYTD